MRWQDLTVTATLVVLAVVVTTPTTASGSPAAARTKRDDEEEEEDAGQGRFLASYFFYLFPQYQNVNYGDTLEFLTQSDTIGYFVVRDVITVNECVIPLIPSMYRFIVQSTHLWAGKNATKIIFWDWLKILSGFL